MKHLSLDIETMGTAPDGAIVQIGARLFNLDGDLGEGFTQNVDLQSAMAYGMRVDGQTVAWWMQQDDSARQGLLAPEPVTLYYALTQFQKFIEQYRPQFVWGNGSSFDNVIVDVAYRCCGLERPWHYKADRDLRTLLAIARIAGVEEVEVRDTEAIAASFGIDLGRKHDALTDATRQAMLVIAAMRAIRGRW